MKKILISNKEKKQALLISNKEKKQALLILVSQIGRKKEAFAEHIAKKLAGHQVVLARFSDLIFSVEGENVEIEIEGITPKIRDFDLIYFRRAGATFLSLAGTLALCLGHWQILFFDRTFQNIGPAGDKFTSYMKLSLAGLPTPPSFFCWHDKIKEKKEVIASKLGLPLVAKQLSSQRGKGVFLLKSMADFDQLNQDYPDGEFLLQKFIQGKGEYRILVLGGTIGAFEKKIQTDSKEFRHNIALGAKEEFIEVKKIPNEMKAIAIAAASALEIQIAGVDIMVDHEGKMWLLEANRGPGLTYDPEISPELDSLASFFAEELNKIKRSR